MVRAFPALKLGWRTVRVADYPERDGRGASILAVESTKERRRGPARMTAAPGLSSIFIRGLCVIHSVRCVMVMVLISRMARPSSSAHGSNSPSAGRPLVTLLMMLLMVLGGPLMVPV